MDGEWRLSALECIGPISKGDIEPQPPRQKLIRNRTGNRSRSDGRSRRYCNTGQIRFRRRPWWLLYPSRANDQFYYVLAGLPGVARPPPPHYPSPSPPVPQSPCAPVPQCPTAPVPQCPSPPVPQSPSPPPPPVRCPGDLILYYLWPGHLLYRGQPYVGEWTISGRLANLQ